jgi:hypothetical protein
MVNVRVLITPEEKAVLRAEAKKRAIKYTEFIRQIIIKHIETTKTEQQVAG